MGDGSVEKEENQEGKNETSTARTRNALIHRPSASLAVKKNAVQRLAQYAYSARKMLIAHPGRAGRKSHAAR